MAVDGQVDGRVLGQQGQHVVEKADAGGDPRLADAVQQQFQFDVGFGRFAVDLGSAGHGQIAPLKLAISGQRRSTGC